MAGGEDDVDTILNLMSEGEVLEMIGNWASEMKGDDPFITMEEVFEDHGVRFGEVHLPLSLDMKLLDFEPAKALPMPRVRKSLKTRWQESVLMEAVEWQWHVFDFKKPKEKDLKCWEPIGDEELAEIEEEVRKARKKVKRFWMCMSI